MNRCMITRLPINVSFHEMCYHTSVMWHSMGHIRGDRSSLKRILDENNLHVEAHIQLSLCHDLSLAKQVSIYPYDAT